MALPAKPHCHQLRKHPLPPISELRKRFFYDPESGDITGPSGLVGRESGKGYLRVSVSKKPQIRVLGRAKAQTQV